MIASGREQKPNLQLLKGVVVVVGAVVVGGDPSAATACPSALRWPELLPNLAWSVYYTTPMFKPPTIHTI